MILNPGVETPGFRFKCLLLQFFEDLSDRELERYLNENNAGKWFCEFGLSEPTPDHPKSGSWGRI